MKKIPLILFGAFALSALSTAAERPNILFISVDDLRPELGCYGNTAIQSPNIDRLADNGIVFEEAYCQVPVCGATRASLMTGLYPTENRFVTYYTTAQTDAPAFRISLVGLRTLVILRSPMVKSIMTVTIIARLGMMSSAARISKFIIIRKTSHCLIANSQPSRVQMLAI